MTALTVLGHIMNESTQPPHEVLTRAEVATRLRVSQRTVYRYGKTGIIRMLPLTPGGTAKYLKADIDRLLAPQLPAEVK